MAQPKTQSKRILLVDDEADIIANIAPVLERSGFTVATAADGIEGQAQIDAFSPDLVVLDVMMPRMDGRSLLRQLRQADDWTPVILLTQVGGSLERAMALQEGADDYLNKPFDPFELIARIQAILRRAQVGIKPLAISNKLRCGPLLFDRTSRQITLNNDPVSLTPKAVTLLEYCMTHPDELLTRDRLLDAVWGWDYPAGTRTVDSRIAELRRVLQDDPAEPNFIQTVPGEGYRFVGKVETAG